MSSQMAHMSGRHSAFLAHNVAQRSHISAQSRLSLADPFMPFSRNRIATSWQVTMQRRHASIHSLEDNVEGSLGNIIEDLVYVPVKKIVPNWRRSAI